MIVDRNNLYTLNNNLLQETSQFILSLNNKIISENVNFMKSVGIDTFEDFNKQLLMECEEYKCYDV